MQVAYARASELQYFEEDYDADVGYYTIKPIIGEGGMTSERAQVICLLI